MDDLIRAMAEATAVPSGIPLELTPLLSPYRRRGSLALRVERLPDRARLSKGRRNEDRTWSLALNELEGLLYLPPEGDDAAHTLAIRIISVDDDYGATLAVLDFPVSPGDAPPAFAPGATATPCGAADRGDAVELRRLRDELTAVAAGLSARETELAEARQKVEYAEQSRQAIAAELTATRITGKAELAQRLADTAAEAATTLEQAYERWQQEAAAALSKAAEAWTAGEAVRLAAAEAEWRDQSARALAEARVQAEARGLGDAAELRRLRDELAAIETSLADREAASAETRLAFEAELTAARTISEAELEKRLADTAARAATTLEQAYERWQQEAAAALSKAAEAWTAGEAVRLAAAEAEWRDQSARALAEARAQAEARDLSDAVELRCLRDELAAIETSLADREAASAETRLAFEAELTAARTISEAELEDHLADAAADAASALERNRAAWRAVQDDRVVKLEENARERIEQAHERGRQEAEAQWRERSARALAGATARFELAEAALAEARVQAEALRDLGDHVEIQRLRDELAAMQAAISERETALAQARSATELARERWEAEAQGALQKAEEAWKAGAAQRLAAAQVEWQKEARIAHTRNSVTKAIRRQRYALIARRLVQGGAVAASVAASVVFYPRIEPVVVERWWPKVASATTEVGPFLDGVIAWFRPSAPQPSQVAERRAVVGVPVANVRSGPSTATAVITTLARDKEVTSLVRRGSWVLVRTGGEDGKPTWEGWVFGSSLKDAADR